jgi:DNA-binding NarL/FixJ family response regulator
MAADGLRRRSQRILVADDNAAVRQELCELLSLVPGVDVVGQAADGAEAVRLASALRPDAVLLDLKMPGIDGYRAASLIREDLPPCRLVALAVHGFEEEREAARRAGFDRFVAKDAPPEAFLEALLGLPAGPVSSSDRHRSPLPLIGRRESRNEKGEPCG